MFKLVIFPYIIIPCMQESRIPSLCEVRKNVMTGKLRQWTGFRQ